MSPVRGMGSSMADYSTMWPGNGEAKVAWRRACGARRRPALPPNIALDFPQRIAPRALRASRRPIPGTSGASVGPPCTSLRLSTNPRRHHGASSPPIPRLLRLARHSPAAIPPFSPPHAHSPTIPCPAHLRRPPPLSFPVPHTVPRPPTPSPHRPPTVPPPVPPPLLACAPAAFPPPLTPRCSNRRAGNPGAFAPVSPGGGPCILASPAARPRRGRLREVVDPGRPRPRTPDRPAPRTGRAEGRGAAGRTGRRGDRGSSELRWGHRAGPPSGRSCLPARQAVRASSRSFAWRRRGCWNGSRTSPAGVRGVARGILGP